MVAKHLLKLAFLALPSIPLAHADTNIAGEEITILNDSETNNSPESLQLTPQADNFSVENHATDSETRPGAATSQAENGTDLWQRIKSGFAIPELKSPFTATHESWYAARPDYVKRMVGRSQKYLYHIVEEVQKRDMPTEIALLPMVESAFNPQAFSTSRASGIWQFVPSTGKHFGLKQNWWVDNRRDVMAATDAALTYLQKLHVMFGSWDLALAAYNAGEGTVMRAIERNRKKGLPTDYQSLNLPSETKNYVPKLQAVKNIVTNPEQYGLDIQPIANQPYFTKVTAPRQIDVNLAAKLAGISLDEFVSLNPEYNRPVLTATDGAHEILLPVGKDEEFAANLANYDKPLVNWQTYYAKRGERQENIARKFGISLAQLRNVNDIGDRSGKLRSARTLLVPAQGVGEAELPTEEIAVQPNEPGVDSATGSAKRHVVKKGETIIALAKRYDVSAKQLMALNHLKSGKLKKGQVLLVEADGRKQVAEAGHKVKLANTHYVVRRGDTLSSIARKFDVATNDLQRWNNLNGTRLTPGHRLKIQKPDAA